MDCTACIILLISRKQPVGARRARSSTFQITRIPVFSQQCTIYDHTFADPLADSSIGSFTALQPFSIPSRPGRLTYSVPMANFFISHDYDGSRVNALKFRNGYSVPFVGRTFYAPLVCHPKPRKLPPRSPRGIFILSNPFLEFCLSTPAFPSVILFRMFVQAFDTLKIPEHRFGIRDTLKMVICLWILRPFFFLLCHESEHTKLIT